MAKLRDLRTFAARRAESSSKTVSFHRLALGRGSVVCQSSTAQTGEIRCDLPIADSPTAYACSIIAIIQIEHACKRETGRDVQPACFLEPGGFAICTSIGFVLRATAASSVAVLSPVSRSSSLGPDLRT